MEGEGEKKNHQKTRPALGVLRVRRKEGSRIFSYERKFTRHVLEKKRSKKGGGGLALFPR